MSVSRPHVARLSALLLVFASQLVAAAPAEKPEAFVRRVYALYKTPKSPGVAMTRPAGVPYYAAPLLDAFAKDSDVVHGEVGVVDADPICACQDFGNLRVKSLAITKANGDTLKAKVAINNLGSNYFVTLTLAPTPAGWRIADVASEGQPSIMAALLDEIAHPYPPEAFAPVPNKPEPNQPAPDKPTSGKPASKP